MAARRAAWGAGGALLLLYALTAAPGVTFWDAGEFGAAFATLGVPHPPGTPLFVLLGRAWLAPLRALGVDVAFASNLLSAACTALAGALTAHRLARWTGAALPAAAAAVSAGALVTVWANATETEVYAASLLLSWLLLLAAERDARRDGAPLLTLYLVALALPLHLSALIAAPVAALLLAWAPDGARRVRRGATVLVATAAVAAVGSGHLWAAGALALCAAALASDGRPGRGLSALGVLALGLTPVLVLLVRARLEAPLDQGHPATWTVLLDVLARRQYEVASLWPRQAPAWLQLANVGQWADQQVALGLDAGIGARWARTPFTLAWVALGTYGSAWHRARDRRSWWALALLLACGSVGVAAWLNLKAGPTFGFGVLPDHAPREARERDYFFVLAWWAWGLWAGLGACALARRLRLPAASGVALAALPVALNWRAADRRHAAEAGLADAYGAALLQSAPPRAVLLVGADNDSYPLWFAQLARGVRPDVTTVTLSLLPAGWYRDELARRHALLADPARARWLGVAGTVRAVAAAARAQGRPIAASLAVEAEDRAALGQRWALRGAVLVLSEDSVGLARAAGSLSGVRWVDTAATRASAARTAPWLARPMPATGDGVPAWAQGQLACAAVALGRPTPAVDAPCRGW